jgi:hypothetical protein
VKSTINTGLAAEDVFYFGNAIGESGDNPANAVVNATDVIGTRDHPHGPLNPAAIDDRFDFNRDRLVNATDLVIARDHATSPLSAMRLVTPTGALPAPSSGSRGLPPRERGVKTLNDDFFVSREVEPRLLAMKQAAHDVVFHSADSAPPTTRQRRIRFYPFE